jgi:ppGpp synthetase/RelA/SpoT-type nucleotidyltranferase
MNIEELRENYELMRPLGERLRNVLCKRIDRLTASHRLALAIPIQTRVKTWDSIRHKIARRSLSLASVDKLRDFVGLRIVLLFKRDLIQMDDLLRRVFDVLEKTDSADKLADSQFGYQSVHYVVKLPTRESRGSVADLRPLMAEIQVRTLGQHLWATASHKLLYKREESVPQFSKRTFHRVSALLETVDLELEQILIRHEEDVLSSCRASVERWLNSGLLGDLEGVDMLAGQTEDRIRPLRLLAVHEATPKQVHSSEPGVQLIKMKIQADVEFWIEGRYDYLFPAKGSEKLVPAERFSPRGKSRTERINIEVELAVYEALEISVCSEIFFLESPFHMPFLR